MRERVRRKGGCEEKGKERKREKKQKRKRGCKERGREEKKVKRRKGEERGEGGRKGETKGGKYCFSSALNSAHTYLTVEDVVGCVLLELEVPDESNSVWVVGNVRVGKVGDEQELWVLGRGRV